MWAKFSTYVPRDVKPAAAERDPAAAIIASTIILNKLSVDWRDSWSTLLSKSELMTGL